MPSRPAAGIKWVRLEVFFSTTLGKEWSNIFWFQMSGAGSVADYQNDAQPLMAAIQAALSPVGTPQVTSEGGVVTFNGGTGSYGVEVYNTVTGTETGDLVPEDVSCVVQRLSGTIGPSGRGRIFVAGIPQLHVLGSYLSTAGITAFGNLALALNSPVTPGAITYTPAFFSTTTGLFAVITEWNEVQLLATNRKRRPRF